MKLKGSAALKISNKVQMQKAKLKTLNLKKKKSLR